MNRIFVTGDTHGTNDIYKLTNKNFPVQEELDKSDVLCIAGTQPYVGLAVILTNNFKNGMKIKTLLLL